MTIGDLIKGFDENTIISVEMKIANPFNKSDVIHNSLYCGEIRGIDKTSIGVYTDASITKAKLCVDGKGHPFMSVLMEGSVI